MKKYLLVLFVAGCSASHVDSVDKDLCQAVSVAQCSVDDGRGVVEGHDGLTTSISSCALCRRAELAFYERAEELGCCEPFPLDACPLGDVEGCFEWQADQHADFIRSSATCDLLVARASLLENWSGFECGGRYCFAPPYFHEHGDQCEGGK